MPVELAATLAGENGIGGVMGGGRGVCGGVGSCAGGWGGEMDGVLRAGFGEEGWVRERFGRAGGH